MPAGCTLTAGYWAFPSRIFSSESSCLWRAYNCAQHIPEQEFAFRKKLRKIIMSKEQIRQVLKEHGKFSVNMDVLAEDADLYEAGMTSHASVNVMLALEDAFDLEFPDRMLKRSVFESINAIHAAIEELTA